MNSHRWPSAVIKPASGIGCVGVMRVTLNEHESGQEHLETLLENGPALIQEHLPSVESDGEVSVVCINGKATHSVRRVPRRGDFLAHYTRGGNEEVITVQDDARDMALRALQVFGSGAVCARVDLLTNNCGTLLVCEVEVVAPLLYIQHAPHVCRYIALAVDQRLAGRVAESISLSLSRLTGCDGILCGRTVSNQILRQLALNNTYD